MARFNSTGGDGSGAPGPTGPQGSAGDSAYDIAVDNGFIGTEQEWLDSLVGTGGSANTADFTFSESTMSTDGDMQISVNGVPGSIDLSAYNGVSLSFAEAEGAGLIFPDNTIQTTAYTTAQVNSDWNATDGVSEILNKPDIATEAAPDEIIFSVSGGAADTMPTFTGSPLFSGTYVKTGPLVHFQIQVDMDNILTFGTGSYYVDLPFPAKYGYQVREGCLHDISSSKQYAIGGHITAGQQRLFLTYTNTNGQDDPFDYNSPVVLSTEDNFHVSGTYIVS